MKLSTIGFDADDTLWQNEQFFRLTQKRFAELLADFTDPETLMARLLAAEERNLGQYGFGIKGFVLSMIETAIEVTDHKVDARVIAELIAAGQDMLSHPIELLPHAQAALNELAGSYRIVLITKGDLLDQERKLAQSGLGDMFDAVEIVSDKTPETYLEAFRHQGADARAAMMVGNSLRSDVLPALQAGAWAVHVPHDLTWVHEQADIPLGQDRFYELSDLGALPALVGTLNRS